jgi:tryptophanase
LRTGIPAPFKGNVDLGRLEEHLASAAKREIGCVVLTLTNNAGGGQPVAVQNVQAVSALCRRHGVPLVLDVCRIAENAYFVQEREDGYQRTAIADIVRGIADHADVLTMSAKKDGLTNIGGFIALRDPALAERIRRRMVVTEGFPTYGGLAGRDLEAMAVGLREALDPAYLAHRVGQVRFLADLLRGLGIPLVEPPGGHGVFVDATAFLDHLPRPQFPGQALAVALYRESGVRSCEIGAVMFGDEAARDVHDLVRLAIPRRTYSNAQLAQVASAFAAIQDHRASVPGVRIVDGPPVLRHFTARFALAVSVCSVSSSKGFSAG